jgi:CelD/BcsL family acetyltransferase involved in cellulose biosynthesis
VTVPSTALRVARTYQEIEALRPAWEGLRWPRVDPDVDFYVAVTRSRAHVLRPHVVLLERQDRPPALVVARIEDVPLDAGIGYKPVYRPLVRSCTVVQGGISGANDAESRAALLSELAAILRRREADVLFFPSLPASSPVYADAQSLTSVVRRDHFAATSLHRRLRLPATMEAFLRSRSRNTRDNVRVKVNRLERDFGRRLTLKKLQNVGEIDEIFRDLSTVSRKTYQYGLGVALLDSPEFRPLVALGLRRRWFRAYVLYLEGKPIAFWQGFAYNGTFYTGTPGYDPTFPSRYSIGTYVLLKVIEDLIVDPTVQAIDFGFGDADYKRKFSSESWKEGDVRVFAATPRAIRINLLRSGILGIDRSGRWAASRVGIVNRVKKRWRKRLTNRRR